MNLCRLVVPLPFLVFTLCGACKRQDAAPPPPPPPSPSTPPVAVAPSATRVVTTGTESVIPVVNWRLGQRYHQVMDATNRAEMLAPGRSPITQEVIMNQRYTISVLQPERSERRVLDLEFGHTRLHVSMNGTVLLRVDTATNAPSPETELFRKMIGSTIRMSLGSSNRIETVEGIAELQAKAFGNMPAELQRAFEGLFSEDHFRQMVEYDRGWPTQGITPGTTWPVKTDLAMGNFGTMTFDSQFSFKQWEQHEEHKCARIEFTGTVRNRDARPIGPTEAMLQVIAGATSGTLWYDPELQMIVDQQRAQSTALAVIPGKKIEGARPGPSNSALTNLMTQNVRVRLDRITADAK